MAQQYIKIKGANEHNLKNIDVTLPRDKFIVLTGLSGSGKSSLAPLILIYCCAISVTLSSFTVLDPESMSKKELEKLIQDVEKKMKKAAAELNFESAAQLRDQMVELKKMLQKIDS